MGRPPLANKMTRAERQRRWRKRKRLGLVGRPKRALDERAAVPEPPADLALIERLTQERDQARRELELALQSVQPRVVGPDNPSRCFVCLRRRPKVMLDLSRRRQEVFLCDECIDEMSRMRAARLEQ